MADDIEALRRTVTELVERRGKQAVAKGAGVSRDTLYAFLRGDDLSPPSRFRLADYVVRTSPPAANAAPATSEPPSPAVAPPALEEAPPGTHAPSYWQGELKASLRSLQAIQDLAGAVAATIQGTLASGVLTAAKPSTLDTTVLTPEERARIDREAEEGIARQSRDAKRA